MPELDFQFLNQELPEPVLFIHERLSAAGFKSYVVGGAVRDRLLGKEPDDYDMATSAEPLEIVHVFKDCKRRVDGMRHGTVGLIFHGKLYEVTSFRADGEYKDHRHPESVAFSKNLADDVFRRDFTINALAFSPEEGILDLVGGLEDLRAGLIRCVGKAHRRFKEDALRMLRAYRFAAEYGFALEKQTRAAALRHLEDLRYIAPERIRAELVKLLEGECFASDWAQQQEMLRRILPLDERLPAAADEGMEEILAKLPPEFSIRLAFLLKPLGEEEQNALCDNLRLSRKEARLFKQLNRCIAEEPETRLLTLMRFARENALDLSLWAMLGSLKSEAASLNNSRYWQVVFAQIEDIERRRLPRHPGELKINGDDLIMLGCRSSRRLGHILDTLWEDVVTGKVRNEVPALLHRADTLIREL